MQMIQLSTRLQNEWTNYDKKLSNDFQRIADWLEANDLIANMNQEKQNVCYMVIHKELKTRN